MQSDVEVRGPAAEKRTSIATPVPSIEAINKVVNGLFSYKRSATYKDIATAVGLHPANVSQALSASRDVGLTTLAGKKGLYVTTTDGEQYVRLITENKYDEAKVLLRRLLLSSPLWAEVVSFLAVSKGVARDPLDLVLDVERKLGKKWSPGMRRAVSSSYTSILSFAGLVRREGGKIVSTVDGPTVEVRSAQSSPTGPVAPVGTLPSLLAKARETVKLQSDEFHFEVLKDLSAIDFAKAQFDLWIEHVRKTLLNRITPESRNGGT